MLKKTLINCSKFVLLATFILVLFTAGFYLFQDKLFFHPRPSDPQAVERYKVHAITLEHEGERLQGWHFPSKSGSKTTLFYYGGNAEEMSQMIPPVLAMGDHNYVIFNYRGYGDSTGKPGEQALKKDAVFIFDQIARKHRIKPEDIFIIGRSLGSGVAVHTTAQRQVAGVILVTPYDSIEHVAKLASPGLPFRPPVKYPFRSVDDLANIEEPGLILRAEEDRVIPAASTDALILAWKSPLQTLTLSGTRHNLIFTDEFYKAVDQFIKSQSLSR